MKKTSEWSRKRDEWQFRYKWRWKRSDRGGCEDGAVIDRGVQRWMFKTERRKGWRKRGDKAKLKRRWETDGWMDGWMDRWMGGWGSVNSSLAQSLINLVTDSQCGAEAALEWLAVLVSYEWTWNEFWSKNSQSIHIISPCSNIYSITLTGCESWYMFSSIHLKSLRAYSFDLTKHFPWEFI